MSTPYTHEQRLASYWEKVDVRGPDECWPWRASTTKNGYGVFCIEGGRRIVASRWGYLQRVGPIPAGYEVCHTCDNPPCQNEAHWFIGTRADNMQDALRKGRHRYILPDNGGARHGMSRLTADQIDEIRRRYAEGGIKQSELAVEFGVRQQQISRIVRRVSWR